MQPLEMCCEPRAAGSALHLKQAVTGSHSMLQYPAMLLKYAKQQAQSLQASSLPTQQDEVWRQMILACSDNGCLRGSSWSQPTLQPASTTMASLVG